jgi:hypothetical protein
MRRSMFALMLVVSIVSLSALAATPDQFRVRSTADLVEICSTPANDPMYAAAISFCHGFAVGAYHYYLASVSGPEGKSFVCLPDPPPSRTEGVQMFVAWARQNPQYMDEPAVETLFRWLATTWPCRK